MGVSSRLRGANAPRRLRFRTAGRACGICLLSAILSPIATPAESSLPVKHQFPLIVKIMTYEKTLMTRAVGIINLGVVYRLGDPESEACMQDLLETAREFGDLRIRNRALVLHPLPIPRDQPARTAIAGARLDALYVTPGFGDSIDEIVAGAREAKSLSITGTESFVERGISVGIVAREGRPRILIHMQGSREEGLQWDPGFLSLCTLLR